MARPRFDPKASFTAARSFVYNGVQMNAGDPFPTTDLADHKVRTLFASRAINQGDPGSSEPVQMSQTRPGYFEITAPWLDEPEKVRGKQNAETRLTELREAGEPDYYKGVEISGGEGGWYEISVDWDDENVTKVQGQAEARRIAAQYRADGPPPEHYAQVTVTPSGDEEHEEAPYVVDAPWLDNAESYDSSEEADARAQLIREVGPPADGYDAAAIQQAREARATADAEQAEAARAEAAEASRKAAYSDGFSISETTTDGVTTYSLNGPGLDEAETFEGETAEADVKARQTELRDAGPPEGWTAPAE